MKTTIPTLVICFLSLAAMAQSEPVTLQYAIGAFRIPAELDKKISERFDQLDPSKTYMATIVGSADFLGSEDNNQVLSNKRVKFAEYHLLKKYRDLRLIIKLDSKGEMHAEHRAKTQQGIQEHRMVYIYLDEYVSPVFSQNNLNNGSTANDFDSRIIATSSAAQAENLSDIPVSIAPNQKKINPISETAQIEIAKQKQAAALENELRTAISRNQSDQGPMVADGSSGLNISTGQQVAVANETSDAASTVSGSLKVAGNPEPRKFDAEGTLAVGERMLLSDLNFRPGSHYLRPSSIPSLRRLIDVLQANPKLKIEIIGHICCHPDYSPHPDGFDREAGNYKLSFNRANNIKEYLEKNGIDPSRIKATGMGAKERLVYPEETDQDRIKNRRVEVKILSL